MDEQKLALLCERPFIPCNPLSTNEIVESMKNAKSRRSVPPPKKRRTAPTAGTRPKKSRKEISAKADKLDEIKRLVAGGMDLTTAIAQVNG